MKFVDTSFWVALRFRRDQRHEPAREIWQARPGALVTTDLVLGETWTFLSRKAGHREALKFHQAASRQTNLTIRHADEDLVADAWRWLVRRDEHPYSFVDATSFALMRRLRLKEALAFDGDFAAAGFVEVRP